MLDTGIDVPDVVNLVFFKPVRSKVKFLQMIGRGTRLRPDLFGPGKDKAEFRIFDYCENFEFFNEQADGDDAAPAEPLHKRLFRQRLELLARLQGHDEPPGVSDEHAAGREDIQTEGELRGRLKQTLNAQVSAMNLANFIVRPEREHVERFQKPDAWNGLSGEAVGTLTHHVAGLPTQLKNDDITARLFDLTRPDLFESAGRHARPGSRRPRRADRTHPEPSAWPGSRGQRAGREGTAGLDSRRPGR
jgi:type I restriction enzyme R subunit